MGGLPQRAALLAGASASWRSTWRPGAHEIELRFGSTLPRVAGWIVTIASLAVLILLAVVAAVDRPKPPDGVSRERARHRRRARRSRLVVVACRWRGDRWQQIQEGLVLVRSGSDLSRARDDGLLTVMLDWTSLAGRGDEYDAWVGSRRQTARCTKVAGPTAA